METGRHRLLAEEHGTERQEEHDDHKILVPLGLG
jgi:hypothetical protein